MNNITHKTKSIFLLLLCLAMLFSFSACKDVEQGKINEVEIEQNKKADEIQSDFNKLTKEPGYKYKYVDVGRAHISIPYPSKWEVTKNTGYDICFTAPKDDPYFPGCQIYFHSSLELCVDQSDIHDVMQEYEGVINNYYYSYGNDKIKVIPSSTHDKSQVNTKISDPNNHDLISYRDFDADVLTSAGRIPNDALYHHVTAFYWKDYSCIISSLCSMDNNESMNDLILYMVSNCKYIDISEKTNMIPMFEKSNKIELPIMDVYEQGEIGGNKYVNSGYLFSCPPDSGSAFSHSFITIFEIDGENISFTENDFTTKYLDLILNYCFGITRNSEQIYGYLDDGGSVKMAGQSVKEYIYRYDFTPSTKAKDVQSGQPWVMACYPVNNNGVTNLIVLVTPEDAIGSTFDTIKLIAKYGKF